MILFKMFFKFEVYLCALVPCTFQADIFILYPPKLLRKMVCSIGVLFLDKCYLVLFVTKDAYTNTCT